ncbi:hypothetical protein JCM11491_006353 [Sporobolomyces phaffii]
MSYSHSQSSHSQSQSAGGPTSSVVYLSHQLSLLSQRTEDLAHLTRVAAEQASYMRLLAANQAALFMAAQKVFVPQEEPEPGHERD